MQLIEFKYKQLCEYKQGLVMLLGCKPTEGILQGRGCYSCKEHGYSVTVLARNIDVLGCSCHLQ